VNLPFIPRTVNVKTELVLQQIRLLEKSFQKIINQFYLVGKPKIKVVPIYLKWILGFRYNRRFFDRNHMPKGIKKKMQQADATSWMAVFLNMLRMALECI
jgi:hypothetical protein